MADRRVGQSWLVMDETVRTWDECYAIRATDWIFAGDAVIPDSTMESELDGPGEKDPVDPTDEEWCLSSPFLPLDLLPPPNSSLPSPSTSWSPPHTAPRIRPIRAASPPSRARRFLGFRAPSPTRHRCGGCCCCNCSRRRFRRRRFRPRRFRPRIYRPGVATWEHLPVVIQPFRWYHVVGSMQCSHCKSRGRHQMTSWMCQSCNVPLCLMPYRNCYAKWHDQMC
ncbi:uncharacterized protein [Pagrus major]|uniref:uncharacterized protein n=1 Tax=Pagrus major TaxID=143350 RepID=UPI003CC897BA